MFALKPILKNIYLKIVYDVNVRSTLREHYFTCPQKRKYLKISELMEIH